MATEFTFMPTREELVEASEYIDNKIAKEMLFLVMNFNPALATRLNLLNGLILTLEGAKYGDWDDIRWVVITGWVSTIQKVITGEAATGSIESYFYD